MADHTHIFHRPSSTIEWKGKTYKHGDTVPPTFVEERPNDCRPKPVEEPEAAEEEE